MQLEPGQEIEIHISKKLIYKVRHTGWAIEIESTQQITVIPKSDKMVGLGTIGLPDEDEV